MPKNLSGFEGRSGLRTSRRDLLLVLSAAAPLRATPLEPKEPLRPADRVIIEKAKRTLLLERSGRVIRRYSVALGGEPVGPKRQRGDHRTPEGAYTIDSKLKNSQYHRALHISYPNTEDRKRAREAGRDPGDAIMIHGLPKGQGWIGALHRTTDWTDGCIAVTNEEIDDIWNLVPVGTPVTILP